jgi:hypothetical protein
MYILVDLDNTIADDKWRLPHIKPKVQDAHDRYHDYHTLSAFDECCNRKLFEVRHTKTIVMTSRPETYKAMTREWLLRNDVPFAMLFMRPKYDLDPSPVLKKRFVNVLNTLYGIQNKSIFAAYDDRQDVVDAYESIGIPARRVAIHD